MDFNLMYITNNPRIAKICEENGVDWIFVDLEINGKNERQGHLDTVISRHDIEDVKIIKDVLTSSELLVRVNPIFEGSEYEINKVINYGADIIMLPFFKYKSEVLEFIKIINNRAKTMLLLETPEAVENIDDILSVEGIDYIHIGLNDLHLGYGMSFMFELLGNGTVQNLCNKIKKAGIVYGFGGIAQLGKGDLPAEKIIMEHVRLGSSMVILSRSFCKIEEVEDYDKISSIFMVETKKLRDKIYELKNVEEAEFYKNQLEVIEIVNQIVNK